MEVSQMLKCKFDIMKTLSDNGYTSYQLIKNKVLNSNEAQKLRHGGLPSWKTLDIICKLLNLQPGDIIEYIPDEE